MFLNCFSNVCYLHVCGNISKIFKLQTFENICEYVRNRNILFGNLYEIMEIQTFYKYCCHRHFKRKDFAGSPV